MKRWIQTDLEVLHHYLLSYPAKKKPHKLFHRHLAHYVVQIKSSFIYMHLTVPIHRLHLKTHCPSF